MTDTKSPLDQAVDLLFYAPVGLAAAARDLVPTLVTRGRQELDPQVGLARMVGQMAVAQGRSQAEKVLERTFAQAQATLRHLGLLGDEAPSGPDVASPAPSPGSPTNGPVATETRPEPAGPAARPAPSPAARPAPSPAAVTLAIPDYDSLSASQVVPRLSSLSTEELDAVRAYEDAHRGRKTILNKIAKLSGH